MAFSAGLNYRFNSDGPAAAEPAAQDTDEDQVRAVVASIQKARNTSDQALYDAQFCAYDGIHNTDLSMRQHLQKMGPTSIKILSLDVDPKNAYAELATLNNGKTVTQLVMFTMENGHWVSCARIVS